MKNLSKNIACILRVIHMRVVFILSVVFVVCWVGNGMIYACSAVLGAFFSAISFIQFSYSQQLILARRNQSLFFVLFCSRLLVYAMPLGIALSFKDYFNFTTTLIFLFTYQVNYLFFEVLRRKKKIKGINNG